MNTLPCVECVYFHLFCTAWQEVNIVNSSIFQWRPGLIRFECTCIFVIVDCCLKRNHKAQCEILPRFTRKTIVNHHSAPQACAVIRNRKMKILSRIPQCELISMHVIDWMSATLSCKAGSYVHCELIMQQQCLACVWWCLYKCLYFMYECAFFLLFILTLIHWCFVVLVHSQINYLMR